MFLFLVALFILSFVVEVKEYLDLFCESLDVVVHLGQYDYESNEPDKDWPQSGYD